MRILLLVALLSMPLLLPQDHSGQPASCDNVSDNPHKCECERAQQDCDPHNQDAGEKSQDVLPAGRLQVRQFMQ